MAVPVGESTSRFRGVIRLNETGQKILEYLKEDTTEKEIVEKLQKEYQASPEQLAKSVHTLPFLQNL